MSDQPHPLEILVVDDDPETLKQLETLLPGDIDGHPVFWDYLGDFEDALWRLRGRRYDLLLSDIYRDRKNRQKNIEEGDIRVRDLVSEIREQRFCPIVLFTDGQVPEQLAAYPFVLVADKGAVDFIDQLGSRVRDLLATGVPGIARKLHDELDRFGGSYVWGFVAENWQSLRDWLKGDERALERVIRRRAAIQLARIDTGVEPPAEWETAHAVDYYVYPPIGPSLRLGEVLRRRGTDEFRVVLTPHCFLMIQQGQDAPRADCVLTARTVPAAELIGTRQWPTKKTKILEALRKRASLPAAEVGTPDGRYCFLPGFMAIPDLYCDLMQLESLSYKQVRDEFERLAVIDTPFAEALQACLSRLYAAVGLPVLGPERIAHLGPALEAK